MKPLTAITLTVAGVYFAPAMHDSKAHAQDAHKQVRPSLVYLKATGQVRGGENASSEAETTLGTGFVVSSDGLVLTTHHIISELGDVEPRTVSIEARIAEKSANARPAAIVDDAINMDLLLLKLPPGPDDYVPVSLGSAYDHDDTQDIYTSGFPRSISYRTQNGRIEAREGPGGYLWVTDLNFEYGQSGSPIYNGDGEVIGVVKGVEGSLNYIVPIEFADSLLAQVRLREMKQQVQKMQERLDALQGIIEGR
jgi:serine protease Do